MSHAEVATLQPGPSSEPLVPALREHPAAMQSRWEGLPLQWPPQQWQHLCGSNGSGKGATNCKSGKKAAHSARVPTGRERVSGGIMHGAKRLQRRPALLRVQWRRCYGGGGGRPGGSGCGGWPLSGPLLRPQSGLRADLFVEPSQHHAVPTGFSFVQKGAQAPCSCATTGLWR
jgi:hypothetical protein